MNNVIARVLPLVVVVASMVGTAGCNEVPYCIGDCTDATTDAEDSSSDTGYEVTDSITEVLEDTVEVIDAPEDVPVDLPADGTLICDPPCVGAETCCLGAEGTECVDTSSHLNHCGECGNRCQLPNAYNACNDGVCEVASCDVNFLDCQADDELIPATWGCETVCFQTAATDELCDLIDNDCDCVADEDVDLTTDPDNCGQCGERCRYPNAEGLCESSDGTPENAECYMGDCDEGYYDDNVDDDDGCEYECTPCETTEGSCGTPPATCCTATGGETCNGIDDNCDGDIDEGNPQSGGNCGSDVGECAFGTENCVGGVLVCEGDTGPVAEFCDGNDNDCDGTSDEPDAGDTYLPDEQMLCSESGAGGVGDCEYGLTECTGGTLDCVGDVGPAAELCDGHDNDCDGTIDNGDPGGGAPCGSDVGECEYGTLGCVAGALVCSGGDTGSVETCNDLDDDCDTLTDEDFLFAVDPTHCGDCYTDCSDPTESSSHAIAICSGGSCQIAGCEPNYWPGPADGCTSGPSCCTTYCEYTGNEVCDGVDNDCDTLVDIADPSFVTVSDFCEKAGACTGSYPVCELRCGATAWYCEYGPNVYVASDCVSIDPESAGSDCDDLDNDCDGGVDEHLPLKGTGCTEGIGACMDTGTYVCSGSALVCNATAGSGTAESCNGEDDNCDGVVDNFSNTAYATIGAVNAGGVYVFQHEASRPNAGSCDPGTETYSGTTLESKACSKAGVQPWTNISWTDARVACQNLGSGWDLCTATQWEMICLDGYGGSLDTWAYASSPQSYNASTCNGNDYDTNCPCGGTCPGGDNDEILDTGSRPNCYADWSSPIYDMTGNVKEWTSTWRLSQDGNGDTTNDDYYEIRGGASNQPAAGLTCQFDFTIAAEYNTFFNLGFRCCR